MRKRMSLWLPLIFAVLHLLVVGGALIEEGGSPDVGIAYYEIPLLVLCKSTPVCSFGQGRHVNTGPVGGGLVILALGTVIYAVIGFIIGLPIDWIRRLIARRREEG